VAQPWSTAVCAHEQACLNINPPTVAAFFAEVPNNGSSVHYGLGAAVEEAQQWGVLLLPPCVLRSIDRYLVEDLTDEQAVHAAGVWTSRVF